MSFFFFVLWLGLCVDVAVDRISRISTSLIHSLPLFFFFHTNHNSLFKTSDQLASVPFSGLRLVNGHLDKSFPESIM